MEKDNKQKAKTSDNEFESEPLDFGFIKSPPGKMYSVGAHRLHGQATGNGANTILFEPGLGGSSFEWLPLAEQLSKSARILLYDRGGYAWSDPGSNPRHVMRLSAEIYLLLKAMQIEGPLVLVGHSYGGLIMRQLAAIIPNDIRGLLLVDASHEEQFTRMAGKGRVAMLPSSSQFVLSAPQLPAGLRTDVRRKIKAFSRMRKTYAALHAEITHFQDSCTHISATRAVLPFPVTVLSRGTDPHKEGDDGERNRIWNELQGDLLGLSNNSKQIIAKNSGHHIHVDEPEQVAQSIQEFL